MSPRKIAAVVGSLRKDSFNRKMVHALAGLVPGKLQVGIVEIGDLPHFNQDLEASPPAEWLAFRQQIKAADAVLLATPEYNRSVPGVLKNALDVGSRPYGQSVWAGKPAAVVSVSPGALGGFGANHHIRQSLMFLDMPVLQQPEAYVGNAGSLFAADGSLANPDTKAFLTRFMEAFAAWIETNRKP